MFTIVPVLPLHSLAFAPFPAVFLLNCYGFLPGSSSDFFVERKRTVISTRGSTLADIRLGSSVRRQSTCPLLGVLPPAGSVAEKNSVRLPKPTMEDERGDDEYDYEYEDEDIDDDDMAAGMESGGASAAPARTPGGASSTSASDVDVSLSDDSSVAFINQEQLKALMAKVVADIRYITLQCWE